MRKRQRRFAPPGAPARAEDPVAARVPAAFALGEGQSAAAADAAVPASASATSAETRLALRDAEAIGRLDRELAGEGPTAGRLRDPPDLAWQVEREVDELRLAPAQGVRLAVADL